MHVGDMSLDWTVALPSITRNSHGLYTDIEMGFPGNQRAVSDQAALLPYNSPSSLPL
jgi:hypothetical protein